MPRYYFHSDDSGPDTEGFVLDDLASAKCEAVKMAGRIICDEAETFWDQARWTLAVTDEDGLLLFTLEIVGAETPAVQPVALPPLTAT